MKKYRCKECDEIFESDETEDLECPFCGGTDIEEYEEEDD